MLMMLFATVAIMLAVHVVNLLGFTTGSGRPGGGVG
jgi:hypothetical protein